MEFVISSEELRRLGDRLIKAGIRSDFLEDIAGLVEAQIKRRVSDEKTAPDGTPWRPWSKDYAKTRHANQSLLISSGDMLEDFFTEVTGVTQFRVGNARIYAGRQNAEREFMGLSNDNVREIEQASLDYLRGVL